VKVLLKSDLVTTDLPPMIVMYAPVSATVVSGALDYKSLCHAAESDKKWLAKLSRRYQYQRGDTQQKRNSQNERASHRQIYDKKQTQQVSTQKSKGL